MRSINYFFSNKLLIVLALLPVMAFSQPKSGQHEALLKQVLNESAKGKCPDELMSALLRGACEQQMPGLGKMLSQRGGIQSADFIGIQASGFGPAEVYRVNFSGSTTMIWMISTGPDGKIVVLWSGG